MAERARHPEAFCHLARWLGPLGPALRMLDEAQVEAEFGDFLFEPAKGVSVVCDRLDPVVRSHLGQRLRHMAKADVLAGWRIQKPVCDPEVVGLFVSQRPGCKRVARCPDFHPGIKAGFAILLAVPLDCRECGQIPVLTEVEPKPDGLAGLRFELGEQWLKGGPRHPGGFGISPHAEVKP